MTHRLLVALCLAGLVSACTWVKLDPQGSAVRVARDGEDLSFCEQRGEIAVAVKHSVAFIERNALKVRDELETMARNEAPAMTADTIQALDEPLYGEQRFNALACRGRTAQPAVAPSGSDAGAAETIPLRGD